MQKKIQFLFVIISLLSQSVIFSQSKFKFDEEDKRAVTLNFRSVNNLILLSATLNGDEITFLLDTGVNKTKIFGQVKDSTILKNAEYITLRSLGSSETVKAYKTENNNIDFGPISSDNQEVYYITDPRFDLSSKLGVNVQGIIGYDFLKDFVFRLNYFRMTLRVYQHNKFNRKLRRFDEIVFRFIRKKPHLKLPMTLHDGTKKELVFLLDTGSSDAFWIFENEALLAPANSFKDFVGYGLEFAVEGKRAKSKSVKLGKYAIEEPRVAYIDSISARQYTADQFKNGIVGSEMLRRFVWFLDYKNQEIFLRPSRYYNSTTNYDRSGLVLSYVGEEVNTIKTPIFVNIDKETNYGTIDENDKFEIRLQISKILQVVRIRSNSPATKTDIMEGDRILKLNGKSVNDMEMEEITSLLSSEEGKRIKIQLKRGEIILKRELFLKSQLN